MESYGTILKQARESKKVDLSTASRETSISRDYLEALENENSEIFHGEAYLIGFLRNYAEYLDIKPDRLISLYRNMKIQESGVPDELIRNLNPEPKTPIIIWSIIGGIVLIFCVLYFAVYRPKQIAKERAYAISEKTQPKIYEVTNQPLNARLYIGDQLSIETKTGKAILTVVSDNNSDLQLNTPSGLQHFELSETRELDCDGDSKPDVVIDVWEISSTEKSRGAEIYVMVKDNDIPLQELDNTTIPLNNAATNVNQVVILEDNRAYPFTMNASFRNPCVFRYEIDRKDSRRGNVRNRRPSLVQGEKRPQLPRNHRQSKSRERKDHCRRPKVQRRLFHFHYTGVQNDLPQHQIIQGVHLRGEDERNHIPESRGRKDNRVLRPCAERQHAQGKAERQG